MTALTSRLPTTWRSFAAFLRQPKLATPSGLRGRAAWRTVGAMLGLHLFGLVVLLAVLSGWQWLNGIDGPAAFDQFPTEWLVPLAVLAAPLAEESTFRGWLSGRPRALWLLGCLIVVVAALLLVQADPKTIGLGLLGALVVAIGGWIVLRKRLAPGWFARNFGKIYFASAALFALVHVFNYAGPGLAHLPMVLPQLWTGLTLGFLRNRVGVLAGMLVHGVSNGLALGLVALGG